MPLAGTGATLGSLIKSNIDALTDEQKKDRDELFRAMGEAIIAHILANGTGAVAVVSVAGVTTGAGTSGPGTGNLV